LTQTKSDYDRAAKLRDRFQGLAVNIPEAANSIPGTSRFWYRKSVKGGNEFVVVDAAKLSKAPAFDHKRLAASLAAAAGSGRYTAQTLPFNTFRFVDNETAITFTAAGSAWRCDLSEYACKRTGASETVAPSDNPTADLDDSPTEFGNDVEDGVTYESPQQGQRGAG